MRRFSSGRERVAIQVIIQRAVLLAILGLIALPGFAQTTPTITLTSSVNPGIAQQSVTFTATLAGPSSTPPPPVPTGTVTFFDASTALYSPVRLNANGIAVFTTSSLSAATHSITASYSGDSNYLPVTSTALSEVIVPSPSSDYDFTSDVSAQNVVAGSTTNFTLTVTPLNGYNGTVTFSCVGLPTGSTCSFSPTSVTPNDTNSAVTSILTVSTTASTTSSSLWLRNLHHGRRSGSNLAFLYLGGMGWLGFVFFRSSKETYSKRSSRWCRYLPGLLLVVFILPFSGCGGSSANPNATPIGSQTFTVNAVGTAGTNGGNTATHQLSLTITVTSS